MPESEAPSDEPAEDTVLTALVATSEIPPPPPREHAKRRWDRAVLMAVMINRVRGGLRMASTGSLAREGIQGHYYLPFPGHDHCSLQVRRCAYMARRSA